MPLFRPPERAFAEALSRVAHANPFLPERIRHEREALADDFDPTNADWNVRADSEGHHPNIRRLTERAAALVHELRLRLSRGIRPGGDSDLALYGDAVLFVLYHQYYDRLRDLILAADKPAAVYASLLEDLSSFLDIPPLGKVSGDDPAHVFAIFFQIRRAFHHTFHCIVGRSPAVVRLRAHIWQSIFTHDLRRYRTSLYKTMGDITTLVTGPSGTGKELVARAIGLSRYVPFDAKKGTFAESSTRSFHPLSIPELSPSLVESELFGHRRGSFTGALEDRAGRLEACPALGTVFLDEVGEIDLTIQVKLLRVLQTRTFQRIGDTETRRFEGKIIAATNRDLAREIRAGRFRRDLYYRLCADLVTTPSLHEQLEACPEELEGLVSFIAGRVAGEQAEPLTREVLAWIESRLGPDYPWPGNFRELEQCVRNILIRAEYHPAQTAGTTVEEETTRDFLQGSLTANELLKRYCTLVYASTGSYGKTARRLRLDRRTVRSKVDAKLLRKLKSSRMV